MACIVPPSAVTNLKEVYSSKTDFNGKDKLDMSKDVQKFNDEQVTQEYEESIDENLRHIVCDDEENEESCHQNQEENGVSSSIVVNKIHSNDRINLNESSKENELRVDDNKSCNTDNNSNTVPKMSKRALSLADNNSAEETNLDKTVNKIFSIVDNEYRSESPEYLHIAEHENNLKNKSLRNIIDSESEGATQTSESNNFPQLVHDIISTAESYRALIDSESEEEKQNEENNTSVIPEETSKSKNAKKKLTKKRKGSIRASKDEAMRQIHSETQRLLRETEISLPYHRPKQRTLQEFLNRKKISATLPKAPSTAAKLKMSSAIVSQVLAEKEKEAELFYKSSDSEDDMQQSGSSVSKDVKESFITKVKEKIPLINTDHTYIQDPKRIVTSTQDNKKEIVQNHLDPNISSKILLDKDFCKVDHQAVKLSFLTDDNGNPDESDTLLQQITNECNQNLPKLGLPEKLFVASPENRSNDVSEMNLDERKVTKRLVETVITFLNKEKCINKNQKSQITTTENHTFEISKIHEDDSEVIDEKDKNQVIEAMEISGTSNIINSKKITETFQDDNSILDNICSNSDDFIKIQDRNNEKKNKCSERNNVSSPSLIAINNVQSKRQHDSSTDEYIKSGGHVQGLPLPKFADETLSNSKLSTLVSNLKVTLRGSPGMIIDLTDNAKPNIKGVSTLLDRFFCKHVNTKKQSDNKPEVTVIHLQNTQNGLLPIKEVLPYKISISTDNSELNKPGAKLMRLKEDLKLQMTLKRNKEWKQKEMELQAQEKEEWENGEEESDYDLDEADEQKKAELGFESNDSEENEPEENDICIKDKKRSKFLFADDEAEVTDNEDSSTEEICNESDTDCVKYSKRFTSSKHRKGYISDEIEINQEEEEEEENNDDDDDDESEEEEEKKGSLNLKTRNESEFKNDGNIDVYKSLAIAQDKNDRKMTQFKLTEKQDDSNITNPSYLRNDNNQLSMATDIDISKAHCEDNDNWISENESNVSSCHQHAEMVTRSQVYKTPLTKTSMLDLVSPITQLSVLNTTLNSNKKDSPEKTEYLIDKHEFLSIKGTQNDEPFENTCNIRNKTILKKKLFDDIGETIDDEYLMRLCSGKFESTQITDLNLFSQSSTTEVSQLRPSESELCSRNFNVKQIDIKQTKNPEVSDKMIQGTKLTSDEDSNSVNYAREINTDNAVNSEFKLRVTSSDDEDDEDTFVKFKKRSAKRFNLSDSEEENSQFSDKESDDIENEDAEKQYVDYDSEENEVIIVPGKDIKKVAASFVEEEAELSGSDWDSADEDEKDLDKLEFEEADDEHIDEHEVKDQLEKIHMKQILDEDKREVRLLKELLFEDGDLHTDGTGRERKFKWRNIDKLGSNIEMPQISDENDGWVDVQEDEEETKWNKLRHERDKFLEERMKCLNNEIEDELCDSQVFKLGLEAIRKIKDNESQRQDISLDKVDLSENMEPIMPRNITDLLSGPNIGKKSQTIYNVIKKRSLLTRGEKSLERIASLAKQGDSASHAVNTRNFVFPHIDQNTDTTSKKEKEIIEDLDSKIKPGKRKKTLNMSASKKRRK